MLFLDLDQSLFVAVKVKSAYIEYLNLSKTTSR